MTSKPKKIKGLLPKSQKSKSPTFSKGGTSAKIQIHTGRSKTSLSTKKKAC